MRNLIYVIGLLLLLPFAAEAQQAGLPGITATPGPGGSQTYSLSIQTLLFLTALSFLPAGSRRRVCNIFCSFAGELRSDRW